MEETNVTQHGIGTSIPLSDAAILLTRFIETHATVLMRILRSYVRKAGLASNNYEGVQEAALELLDEVYIEAVKTCDHFDTTRSPQAWLLAIASHLVSHKRAELARLRQHEIPMCDLPHDSQQSFSGEDSLDCLSALIDTGPEEQVESQEQVEQLLSLVSEGDRYILQLSLIQDLDGEALAQELGCTYNAAHVRLHRARQRLRAAIERQRGGNNG